LADDLAGGFVGVGAGVGAGFCANLGACGCADAPLWHALTARLAGLGRRARGDALALLSVLVHGLILGFNHGAGLDPRAPSHTAVCHG